MKKKPFSFRVSLENIKRFKNLSAEDKLTWLQETNDFIRKALSQKRVAAWKKFRLEEDR